MAKINLFIIDSLLQGGAELQFLSYLKSSPSKFPLVFYLKYGPLVSNLDTLGVPAHHIFSYSSLRLFLSLFTPNRRVATVDAWMYKSSILSCLFAVLYGSHNILFKCHIRHTSVEFSGFSNLVTYLSQRLLAILLRLVKVHVVFCAYKSFTTHSRIFPLDLNSITYSIRPNSINSNIFSFSESNRLSIRKSLSIPLDSFVIGNFSRFHPIKNHKLLLESFASFSANVSPQPFLILAGAGVTLSNSKFYQLYRSFPSKNIVLVEHLSHRSLASLYSAIDLYFLSSFSEGFPNSLLEALSCSVVTLSVDAGDSHFIQPPNHFKLDCFDSSHASRGLSSAYDAFCDPNKWNLLKESALLQSKSYLDRYANIFS